MQSPFDMYVGLVPRMGRCKCRALSNMYVGLVPCMVKCKCRSFSNMYVGLVPHMVECKCRSFLKCMLDRFLAWSNVSASHSNLGSYIRTEEDL